MFTKLWAQKRDLGESEKCGLGCGPQPPPNANWEGAGLQGSTGVRHLGRIRTALTTAGAKPKSKGSQHTGIGGLERETASGHS